MSTANPIILAEVLTRLEGLGVEVPGVANYRALRATLLDDRPPGLDNLLDLSPEQLSERVREAVTAETARRTRTDRHEIQADAALAGEFAASMASHFDEILVQLAPVFDPAAEAARWLREAGVTPRSTHQSLFLAPREVRVGWLEFINRHAPRLTTVQGVVNDLATITNVVPQTGLGLNAPPADGGVFLVHPYSPGSLDRQRGEADWCRWLSVAPRLQLVPLADLNQTDRLRAAGTDVPSLIGPAIRQLTHELIQEMSK